MTFTRTELERFESPREEAPAPPQPAPAFGAGLTPANVLALQRAGAGNHAIARTLARAKNGGYVGQFSALQPEKDKPKRATPKNTQPNRATKKQTNEKPMPGRAVERAGDSFAETQRPAPPKPARNLPEKQPAPAATVPAMADADQDPNVVERDRLIGVAHEMVHEGEYALSRIQRIPENDGIITDLTAQLAKLRNAPKQAAPKANVKAAIGQLKRMINDGDQLIELAYPLPAKAKPTDGQFNQIKTNIENRMKRDPWEGAAKGGVLDIEIDPGDDKLRDKIRAEFPPDREIKKDTWPGKKPGDKAYYYVTAKSLSGFAYDITAHAFPSGRKPSPTDRGTTVHVLHFSKLKK